ncbi:MAG TPA: type II toxin-antitoxin system VapC family toxin [Thauera sp.]|uniref:type II toxin-antitoxin system VapC family toxin n=1 Tax=Thauera sp. TaxID=1905334 RepID=UPI002D149E9A|nr:type II toxin-antitoxin system VapC family toxin [Thauera sp.]HRP22970.1 type II toxin-antitoxin system VapC family toxin [Thauera sp.]HRP65745.1 type II toxin-antitoxin system VapC family toxin [Thauera sp.]
MRIEQAWRAGELAVSAISLRECAMLVEKGHIVLSLAVEGWRAGLLRAGLLEIPLDGRITLAAAGFADLHRDPADRFIVASAVVRNATLVTADEKLLAWKADPSRLDARR